MPMRCAVAMTLVLAGLLAGNPAAAAEPQKTKETKAPPLQAPALEPAPGNPVLVISTSLGDITVELFQDRAPVSSSNFLQYATDGFYAGTIFHRVKPGFMIQGGGFTAAMEEKPTRPPILNEASDQLRNVRNLAVLHQRCRQPRTRPHGLFTRRIRLRGVRPRVEGHGRRGPHCRRQNA
jgi:hypothetical protein